MQSCRHLPMVIIAQNVAKVDRRFYLSEIAFPSISGLLFRALATSQAGRFGRDRMIYKQESAKQESPRIATRISRALCLLLRYAPARVAGPPLRVLQRWDLCRLRRDFDLVFTPLMDCCDASRRPRRSHLYRERKGGPAPELHSFGVDRGGTPS